MANNDQHSQGSGANGVAPPAVTTGTPHATTQADQLAGAGAIVQSGGAQAEAQFRRALAVDANDLIALNGLGLELYRQQRFAEAEPFLRKATELRPGVAGLLFNLGLTLRKLGRQTEAAEAQRAALVTDQSYVRARAELADILYELNRFDEAERECTLLLAIPEQAASVENRLGQIAFARGQPQAEEAHFRAAAALNPAERTYHYNLGLALRRLNRQPEAVEAQRAALTADQTYAPARLELSGLLLELKRLDEAEPEFTRLLTVPDQAAAAENGLGLIALARNQAQAAEVHLRRALQLNGETAAQPGYHFNHALALHKLKRLTEAETELRVALISQDYAPARCELGSVLFDLERFAEAEQEFARLTSVPDQATAAENGLGQLAFARNQLPDAELHFRRAVERNGGEPRFHFNLGLALQARRRSAEALREFDRAVACGTDDFYRAYPYHMIGFTLGRQGRFGSARKSWDKAAEEYERGANFAYLGGDSNYFQNFGGTLHTILGKLDSAEEVYRRGLELDRENIEILAGLADLYLEQRDESPQPFSDKEREQRSSTYSLAQESYNEAVRLLEAKLGRLTRGSQGHSEAIVQQAQLLIKFEEYQRARVALSSILDPGSALPISGSLLAKAYSTMGVLAMRQERFEEAVGHFEHALGIEPDDLLMRSNLAEAYLKCKRLDQAEAEYRKVLGVSEDFVEALIGLGEVYTAMADNGETDLYGVAVDYFSRGRRVAQSMSRSKRLKRKEEAAMLYSRGFARVRSAETTQRTANRTLRDALDDFRQCRELDPEHYRSERARKKVADYLQHSVPERVEKYGPSIVFVAALAVLIGSQAILYLTPPKGGSYIGYWALATFGALIFMIAGLYLPQLLKLKIAGIELEKSAVDQVATPVSLGITR